MSVTARTPPSSLLVKTQEHLPDTPDSGPDSDPLSEGRLDPPAPASEPDFQRPGQAPVRRQSFGFGFLSFSRGSQSQLDAPFMSNSPTLANLLNYAGEPAEPTLFGRARSAFSLSPLAGDSGNSTHSADFAEQGHGDSPNDSAGSARPSQPAGPQRSKLSLANAPTLASEFDGAGPSSEQNPEQAEDPEQAGALAEPSTSEPPSISRANTTVDALDVTVLCAAPTETETETEDGRDKDGTYSLRLTPIIDHLASNMGLYFAPIIRRIEPMELISVGRYTEKHKNAAHAPQGSLLRIVFKSKVVSRTHALFQCDSNGLWFLKDCKLSSGTFLNNIRLLQASQELTLWPVMDGDVVQLGLDYRGGTEEVYRCVKMRCEFNRSWQRKVNRFNLDIHEKMRSLGLDPKDGDSKELMECAICLLKLEPCQALFISPCSHLWHYKCIRPLIIKQYPQFYCPNCRLVCDLETDIEDED